MFFLTNPSKLNLVKMDREQGGYGEARAFLDGSQLFAWPVFEEKHGNMDSRIGVSAEAIPLVMGFDQKGMVWYVMVTDYSKRTKWHHNPEVAVAIRNHANLKKVADGDLDIGYYDIAIVGDWTEIKEASCMKWYKTAIKKSDRFYGQTYSDDNGEWRVPDIMDYAEKNKKKSRIPITKLLHNLEPTPNEKGEEKPGTPSFIARAEESDLSYPIIAVEYPDGLFIADGVHRLWKAKDQGEKFMTGYLINHDELFDIPLIKG